MPTVRIDNRHKPPLSLGIQFHSNQTESNQNIPIAVFTRHIFIPNVYVNMPFWHKCQVACLEETMHLSSRGQYHPYSEAWWQQYHVRGMFSDAGTRTDKLESDSLKRSENGYALMFSIQPYGGLKVQQRETGVIAQSLWLLLLSKMHQQSTE
ncbi:hypothetical protein ILYODFUR_038978 [Ilyodon furcidens]|uniref:Uncharacterized protein n=1 Tax=Ilyodon furcidens TaxID=33524 RepID=A0ABV0UPZ2_9TELE